MIDTSCAPTVKMISTVISGGQTGADRAGLAAAMDMGIPVGGHCPKGRRAEDGRVPDHYPLEETESSKYPPRTALNVKNSDVTLIFVNDIPESGSKLTVNMCHQYKKPYVVISIRSQHWLRAAEIILWYLARFFNREGIVINVAGSRESKLPGITKYTMGCLTSLFGKIDREFLFIPVYTMYDLLSRIDKGMKVDLLPFWKPDDEGPGCMSQWSAHSFVVDGVTYPTAEHYMMAEKAKLFKDTERLDKILAADTPARARQLGREVTPYKERAWNNVREFVVTKGNYYKFTQNPGPKEYLLSTGNQILVEASPSDDIWGIKMAADNPYFNTPSKWNGTNKLGFALMNVRRRLKFKFNQKGKRNVRDYEI